MHASVCDYILDCLQNSIESGAALIELDIREDSGEFFCAIRDNGCGMDKYQLEKARDPFFTDGKKHVMRKVGLGLPFLVQAVELCGGKFSLASEKGKGTVLEFSFPKASLDIPPLGDLSGTVRSAMCFPGNFDLRLNRSIEDSNGVKSSYTAGKNELIDILGDLESSSNIALLRQYLDSQEEEATAQDSVLSATPGRGE